MQMYYSDNRADNLYIEPAFAITAERRQVCEGIAGSALSGLFWELCAFPKPGLVSFIDSGSHDDMDASTFLRSIFSLQGYFRDIAEAGMHNAPYDEMRRLGIEAESRMLQATGHANTHRGAIFSLGLLAAAAGFVSGRGQTMKGDIIGRTVRLRWGDDILLSIPDIPCSHGTLVACQYGVAGAREEAAAGFPHVFKVGLPALQEALLRGADIHSASIQSFFSLMAVVPDNNLLFRGGEEGLSYAQAAAMSFLDAGGIYQEGWKILARTIHHAFITRRLSPGGSADLLAATIFVHQIQSTSEHSQ